MENYLWQKTLLNMYQDYERIAIMIDNKFNRLVSNSLHNKNSSFVYEEMLSCMTRKNNCLLAREIVEEALNELVRENKNILSYYHKDGMSFKNIALREQINIRQVFRNYDKELASFAYLLSQNGFPSDIIQKEFGEDSLFENNYNKVLMKFNNKNLLSVQMDTKYVDDNCKQSIADEFCTNNFDSVNTFINLD